MKAILLAAGEGSRLRPYTEHHPKCLVEVEGKSLLARQLEILKKAGVDEQIIVGGYLAEQLNGYGSDVLINPVYDKTNMVWTLFCAEKELEGDIIVTYGDIVYSFHHLEKVLESDADIAVAIDLNWEQYWRERQEDPLEDAETLRLSDDGDILELGKKPTTVEEIQGQYMGLMKFSEKGTEILKKVFRQAKEKGSIQGRPVENAYMTDLLQEIIDQGYQVKSVPVKAGWVEIDTAEDFESSVTRKRVQLIDNELEKITN
jgi:L-glutamine-phosphate cytidylyltransferase